MDLIFQPFVDLHNYVSYDMPGLNKYASSYPLLGSPIPLLLILFFYYYFCTKLGPELMKLHEPLALQKPMIAYNFLQMIANGYVLLLSCNEILHLKYLGGDVLCVVKNDKFNVNVEENYFTTLLNTVDDYSYYYFLLKIVDLIDTIFMVFKKNYHQITVLHVYHHASMPLLVYVCMKYLPPCQNVYATIPNLFVHVVMYGYYLLTTYNPQYKKSIALKKSITIVQLLQFVFGIYINTLITFFNNGCPVSMIMSVLVYIQGVLFIFLFSNFYYQTYIRKKNK